MPDFCIHPLTDQDRGAFTSGLEALDRYFRIQVTQDSRRHITACFVAIHQATQDIAGYYTLSAADIPTLDVPEALRKRLPRYPTIPAARIGRLAVDQRYQGRKLGSALLADAAIRVAASDIAAFAIVVDAKDDSGVAFYAHHGFVRYGSAPNHLIAPIKSLLP